MDTRVMERLENIEDRIENIKWLIAASFTLKKAGVSETIDIIRKNAGIFGKGFPKGTAFENKIRKSWKANFLRRTA